MVTFHGRSSTVSSQVRIQPPSGLCSLRAFQLADLAQCGFAHLLGQVGGLDPGPVVIRPVGLALTEFLADRGQLLTEQEILLLLVHSGPDVLGDLVVDLDLGQVLARPVDEQRSRSATSSVSSSCRFWTSVR